MAMVGRVNAVAKTQEGKANAAEFLRKRLEVKNVPVQYSKYLDPEIHIGYQKLYVLTALRIREVVNSTYFGMLITTTIVMAGINVGIQTYPNQNSNPAFNYVDDVVLSIFTMECASKIIAEGAGPWLYFIGVEWKWNMFDFAIVMLSMPYVTFLHGSVAFLRLVRLLRLAKLVRKVPQLQMIVYGLVGGLKSIFYIMILLLLVLYMYGVAGVFAFSGSDPWHFRTLDASMITLFSIACLDNWTEVLLINYYGCDYYPGSYYVLDEAGALVWFQYCSTPQAMPVLSVMYFVSFVVISAFVMLSLFIGAVTISMAESMELMKLEAERERRITALKRAEQDMTVGKEETSESRTVVELKKLLKLAWEGESIADEEQIDYSTYLDKGYYGEFGRICHHRVEDPRSQNFILVVILMAGVQAGITTDTALVAKYPALFNWFDKVVVYIFTVELALKIFGEQYKPWKYFMNKWNCFDFVIVVVSYASGSGSLLTMLRLVRLLRALKLIRQLPQLQVIITALVTGLSSISFISIILFMFYYFCAIIAIVIFGTNDPWHFGTLHMAILTLFYTLDSWTALLYTEQYGCDVTGYSNFPSACTDPQGQYALAAAFFVVFITVSAFVLLSLFIGVVTTSMEEATAHVLQQQNVEKRVQTFAQSKNISDFLVGVYRQLFDLLDLDKGGTIEEDELQFGLSIAGKEVKPGDIKKILAQVDSNKSGEVDFAEFFEFMILLRNSTLARTTSREVDTISAEKSHDRELADQNVDYSVETQSPAPRTHSRGMEAETKQ